MLEFLKKLFQFIFRLFGADETTEPDNDNNPPPEPKFPYRSDEISDVELTPGLDYIIQEADAMEDSTALSFEKVAEHHGMHRTSLREFNQKDIYRIGDTVYIPSVDELCFMEYCRHHNKLNDAVAGYLDIPPRPNRAMLDTDT